MTMDELIKVTEKNGNYLVSARELQEFLGAKDNINTWFKYQIDRCMLIEDQDYTTLEIYKVGNQGGLPKIDYAVKIEAAKEIAMVNGGEKGKIARTYFIECEKKLKQPLSEIEILQRSITLILNQQKELKQIESRVEKLEVKAIGSGELQHFSILAFCNNIHKQISLDEAKNYGQKCSRMCTQMGFQTGKVPDPRFGTVKTYPLSVLESIIK